MWWWMLISCGTSPAPVESPAPAPAPTVQPEAREPESPARPDRSDCRAGLLGVLAGMPGLPAGAGRTVATEPVPLTETPGDGATERWTRHGLVPADGGEALCRKGWGDAPCVTIPFAPEAMGLPVFAVRGDQAQVAAGPGPTALGGMADCARRRWVTVEQPLQVLRLAELLRDAPIPVPLEGWARQLFDAPGGTERTLSVDGAVHLRIHEVRDEGGRVWIDAAVLPGEPCGATPEPVDRGWLPATDASGRLQVWFFTDC